MKKALCSFLFLPIVVPASLWLGPQKPGKTPGTIRVEVNEVPVDVIVTDTRRRPVLDLKKDDFIVLENNVPQQILHFSLESYVSEEERQEEKPGDSQADPGGGGSTFGNPHYRTFLIVMGRGRHQYFRTIPKLIEFVRTGLHPTDRIAVMAYNRATDFVTDHDKVGDVLEKYREVSPSIEAGIELRERSGPVPAIYRRFSLSLFQKEIDQIFDSGQLGYRKVSSTGVAGAEQQAARDRELYLATEQLAMDQLGVPEGEQGEEPAGQAGGGRGGGGGGEGGGQGESASSPRIFHVAEQVRQKVLLEGMGFGEYARLRTQADKDEESLDAAIEYMRYMEGEKHLIFLHDQGLPVARLDHDRGVAAKASAARVRLHSIQTGGVFFTGEGSILSAGPDNPGFDPVRNYSTPRGLPFPGASFNHFSIQSIARLSRLTGGQSFAFKDIGDCLKSVERVTASSYLLGYVSSDTRLDGRYRRIEVRVKRPGVRATHRRGYYAEAELKPFDRKQLLTNSRISTAAALDELVKDIDFSLEAKTVKRTGSFLVHSTLRVRPRPNLYTFKADRYVGEIAISYFLFDSRKELFDESWHDLDMSLKPETFDRVMREGFPVEKEVVVPPGMKEALFRVVIYDPTNDRVGSAEVTLKLSGKGK